MADYAKEAISLRGAPALKRLRDMIELAGEWEPFAFTDLYEQARAGKLDPADESVVRSIQCREFELLFVHCFEAATGKKLAKPESAGPAKRRPPARARTRRSVQPTRRKESPRVQQRREKPALRPMVPGSNIGIQCPKCRDTKILSAGRRGTKEKCEKCGTVFIVPQEKQTRHPASKG